MGHDGDRHNDERDELGARLNELEKRLRELGDGAAGETDDEALIEHRMGVLQEAFEDLKTDVLDLHNQLATVVSSCERILAGGRGVDVSLDRGLHGRGAGFQLRRAARRVARATVGVARRAISSRDDNRDRTRDLDFGLASEAVTEIPSAALVLVGGEGLAGDEIPTNLPCELFHEAVVWNSASGRATLLGRDGGCEAIDAPDRQAIAERLAADVVVEISEVFDDRSLPILELALWSFASESVAIFAGGLPGVGGDLVVASKGVWAQPDSSMGDGAVRAKVVGAPKSGPAALVQGPRVEGAGDGAAYLIDPGEGRVLHRVAPLDGVVPSSPRSDPRPAVLVILGSSSPALEIAAWMVHGLQRELAFSLIVAGGRPGGGRRLAALSELAPVYPLDGLIDPEVWPSLVGDFIRAREVGAVVRIGDATGIGVGDGPAKVVDLPFEASPPSSGAGVVLALGRGIETVLDGSHTAVTAFPACPQMAREMPDPEHVDFIRGAFSVGADTRLVVAPVDLVPHQRPEDVPAVARRLRHLSDTHVLLVGDGELAGTVSDIARYFGLANFTLAPRTHDLFDLAMAADAVLLTGERDPWSTAAAAAVALKRPLIATDVLGRAEFVAASGSDLVTLVPAGDVAGLAASVESALACGKRPRPTKKAWKDAAVRSRKGLKTVLGAIRTVEPEADGSG